MNKAKMLLLALIVLAATCFSGCSIAEIETENDMQNDTQRVSMFVEIEETNAYMIVYHKETKVMYAVSASSYNYGNFELLVNADGTPMVWKG